MRTFLAPLAASLLASLAAAQVPPPKPAADPPPTALVVIDVQNFYFPGGRMALADPLPASLQAKRLLERFRAKGSPVVHVQHLPKGQEAPSPDTGDVAYRIHANVLPAAGETVVGKHHANAFRDTDLLAVLRRIGASRLVIAGMQTHMCVEAATRAAADLGFDVVVVHDACATRGLKFGATEVPAAQVHAAALAAMSGSYARVVSTDELLDELK
jgi:nicotinamidase-related amidase